MQEKVSSPTDMQHYQNAYAWATVYPKAAKRSIPCAPLLSLMAVRIAAAELLANN